MSNATYAEKSRLMLEETIEALRNKPVKSSYLECRRLQDEASALYVNLPQPLRLGYCTNYVLENASCPVAPHDILLGRFVECVPNEEEEKQLGEIEQRFNANQHFTNLDHGHTTLDWEEILRLGIGGYIEKTEQELQRRMKEGAQKERLLFLQGMILVYRAYQRYILRYAQAAQNAGLQEAAEICSNLAQNPPATFIEAMQLILFVTSIYSIYSSHSNATLTCGRMDDLLAPYYERDVEKGILTREDAACIIDDFNCKSAIILGRGEHQMSDGSDTGFFRNPMYDSPTYVIIGGRSNTQDHRKNPLTRLFVERIHPRLENPVYVFRRTEDVDEQVWRIVCDKLRQNSALLVYNDETVIPSMLNAGVEPQDALNYSVHGCNWPDIQGLNTLDIIGGPMPKLIMKSLFDENGRPRQEFPTMDSIYEKIGEDWRQFVRSEYQRRRRPAGEEPQASDTLKCVDCFKRGTIEAATTEAYAIKYPFVVNLVRHIGTAADIMAALEETVYGKDPVEMSFMADALAANFVGYEDLWKRCHNAPKYGQDDDKADKHAVRLMNMLTDIVQEETVNPETGVRDIYALSVTITDMNHIKDGKEISATPDGRLSGAPLSENLSPSQGASQSVTALLNSVSKLPFEQISSGALNIRMPKNLVSGEDGLMRLMVLLETYFENGGMQAQLSIADTAELRDAQLHPEKYRDLMVRITGYSAVFVDMCRSAQNEIIRRDEVS